MNDPKVVRSHERGGWGCDAVWADDFHHALRVLLTGDRDGYYAEFGEIGQLAKAFRRPHVHDGGYSTLPRAAASAPAPTTSRPSASWSSTRTTTRSATARSATGCRAEARPLAALCTLLSPFTPMLFQGEEHGEAAPVPVLRRPHRRGDRGRHPRGPAPRVRRLRGVRRRGGARPAGPRDLRALQAHARGRARGAARPVRAAARGAPRGRPGRGARRRSTSTRAGCGCAAASTSCSPTSPATRVHVPVERAVELELATHRRDGRARLRRAARRWPGALVR